MLSIVENGQYFMTKDTGDLTQFRAVTCREYILPREEAASHSKGWIQGNTKIGPVLQVATRYLHDKYGVEVKIMFLNKNNTHSWVRISPGSNKFVVNLTNNETEIPEDKFQKYTSKLSAKDFACRSKAKAKPQRREPVDFSPSIIPMKERIGSILNQGNMFLPNLRNRKSNVSSSSFTTNASRRERSDSFLGNPHWSDDRWKVCLAAGGGSKRRCQYCTDVSGIIIYFRALQGHSGRNFIDLSLQDNVVIPSNFFRLFFILLDVRSIKVRAETNSIFYLLIVCTIVTKIPRYAQYLYNAWKKSRSSFFGPTSTLL